jgi:hypothetical protein
MTSFIKSIVALRVCDVRDIGTQEHRSAPSLRRRKVVCSGLGTEPLGFAEQEHRGTQRPRPHDGSIDLVEREHRGAPSLRPHSSAPRQEHRSAPSLRLHVSVERGLRARAGMWGTCAFVDFEAPMWPGRSRVLFCEDRLAVFTAFTHVVPRLWRNFKCP